jgi:glycosyltransferase involved in cell wall biosynthesis
VRRLQEFGARPESCFRAPYALDPFSATLDDERPRRVCRFLFVGQLIPRKGLRELVAAVDLARRHGDVSLTIAGAGPLRSELIRTVRSRGLEDSVTLVGHLEGRELELLYASHDVFAFPSLADSFGVVVVEAMRAGLPVIASRYAGATEDFVEDGVTGRVIDPLDPEQLLQAILEAASRPSWRLAAGERASKRATKESPADVARTFLDASRLGLLTREHRISNVSPLAPRSQR